MREVRVLQDVYQIGSFAGQDIYVHPNPLMWAGNATDYAKNVVILFSGKTERDIWEIWRGEHPESTERAVQLLTDILIDPSIGRSKYYTKIHDIVDTSVEIKMRNGVLVDGTIGLLFATVDSFLGDSEDLRRIVAFVNASLEPRIAARHLDEVGVKVSRAAKNKGEAESAAVPDSAAPPPPPYQDLAREAETACADLPQPFDYSAIDIDTSQMYDVVFLVGPRCDFVAARKLGLKARGFKNPLVIGGKKGLSEEQIFEKLNGKIYWGTQIQVHAHGNIVRENHAVNLLKTSDGSKVNFGSPKSYSSHLLRLLSSCSVEIDEQGTKSPLCVMLSSCYSSYEKGVDLLPNGSILITHSHKDNPSYAANALKVANHYLKKYKKNPNHFQNFYETIGYTFASEGFRYNHNSKVFMFNCFVPDKPLDKKSEIRAFKDRKQREFYDFLFGCGLNQQISVDSKGTLVRRSNWKNMPFTSKKMDNISTGLTIDQPGYIERYFDVKAGSLRYLTSETGLLYQIIDRGAKKCLALFINKTGERYVNSRFRYLLADRLLHHAAREGFFEAVQALVSNSANVNYENSKGMTPLMYACDNGHKNIAKLLLEHGANAGYISRKNNVKAIVCAASVYKNLDVVKLLLEHNDGKDFDDADKNTALIWAAKCGSFQIVRLLCNDYGCNVNYFSPGTDKTPLIVAVCDKKLYMERTLRVLVELGADLNLAPVNGNTPLHFAVWHKQEKMVEELLRLGADPKITNNKGETPLDLAKQKSRANKKPNRAIIALLERAMQPKHAGRAIDQAE